MTRVVVLCALFVAASCADELPRDGASCARSVCSERGACTFQDTHPVCACDEGYVGAACSRCADGYHRAADDSCVVDEVCAPASCANGGACFVDEYGAAACACAIGFGGATCTDCRAGYHGVEDGGCALDEQCHDTSCARGGACATDGGRVSCTCNAGRAGEFCEQFTQRCADGDPCAATGRCTDRDGVVRCVCQPGWGGATCATCAAGFVGTDAGCAPSDACLPSSCSFVGACSLDGGATTCACQPGYDGARCERCATGFHRALDFTCVADETCAASSRCSSNGTCREQGGATVCDCAAGYAGVACESCAPGFHQAGDVDGGVRCELDTTCRPESCRFHGDCSSDGGATACACQPGFGGAHCETNVDDCVNNACNGARCVDLLTSYVCLCDGGVYAQGCP